MESYADLQLSTPFLEDELSKLEDLGSIVRFPAGNLLMGQGEETDFALLLKKGHVKVVVGQPSRAVAIRGPGELVGEMSAIQRKPRTANIYALDQVEALYVPGDSWIQFLLDNSRAALAQLYAAHGRVAEATRLTVESVLSAEQKVAKALIGYCDRGLARGSTNGWTVDFSQRELAELAGISIDSVKQVIRSLKARSIVHVGRNSTTIVDLDEVRRISRGLTTSTAD